MTKNEIIQYVIDTPDNSNPNVLRSMLDELPAGGDSDFSVANVTFYVRPGKAATQAYLIGCVVESDQSNAQYILSAGITNLQLILYKQQTALFINGIHDVSCTGNCIHEGMGSFIVTGDCEIIGSFD